MMAAMLDLLNTNRQFIRNEFIIKKLSMIIDNMEIFVNRGRSEDITNGSSIVK